MTPPRVAILVPRRDDGGPRDAIWRYCRDRWAREHPDWPIVEGYHRDGLFNRSAALNVAAKFEPWDVAVIIDSDVVIDPTSVREGVRLAAKTGGVVLPYMIRKNLDQTGTDKLIEGDRSYIDHVPKQWPNLVSSVVIVPRALWDEVGGFDEAFRGWGGEDDAFIAAARTFGGRERRLDGVVWHLHHPGAPDGRRTSPNWRVNSKRARRYLRAQGKPELIRELQAEVDTIRWMPELPATGIPRILHRVVPEVTTHEVEAFWSAFGDMHPGWQLMTHRDPLDPSDWPLTAPHWGKAENGAQFADMIRLEALLRFGGVYVDSDCEPLHSLEPLLNCQAFAAWEDERCIPNAVMGATRGHPAMRECLELMLERLPGPTWPAGPGVTTEVLAHREDVLVLPPGAFYPVHYRDPDRDAKMSDPQLLRRNPWAFVLHRYAGSWLAEKPRPVAVPSPVRMQRSPVISRL